MTISVALITFRFHRFHLGVLVVVAEDDGGETSGTSWSTHLL